MNSSIITQLRKLEKSSFDEELQRQKFHRTYSSADFEKLNRLAIINHKLMNLLIEDGYEEEAEAMMYHGIERAKISASYMINPLDANQKNALYVGGAITLASIFVYYLASKL